MPLRRSGDAECVEWLNPDYRRRRDQLRTPAHPKRSRHTPEPARGAYGQYGALRDEIPEEDMDWGIDGPDGDPMEDFGITAAREERLEPASRSSRHREEEEYMEGIHR